MKPDHSHHPLGPLLLRTPARRKKQVRRRAVLVTAACAVLLAVAGWLKPSPAGIGTHRQFGVGACSWPVRFGIPCPTCGMTTAFAHTVRGQWSAAFSAQPLGCLLSIAVILTMLVSIWELTTGAGWRINWYRLSPVHLTFGIVLLLLTAWIYKIVVIRVELG